MSEAIEIARNIMNPPRLEFLDEPVHFVFTDNEKILAKAVLEQDKKIKELQEAVSSARKIIQYGHEMGELDCETISISRDWLQKYGLEKEGEWTNNN